MRGRDEDLILALAALTSVLDYVQEHHMGAPVFIGGDANVNQNNLTWTQLFSSLLTWYDFVPIYLNHPTYHHLMGNGVLDSQLNEIAHYVDQFKKLKKLHCKLDEPIILSCHDIVITTYTPTPIPYTKLPSHLKTPRVSIPRYSHLRWWRDSTLPSNSLWCPPLSPIYHGRLIFIFSCQYSHPRYKQSPQVSCLISV